MGTPVYLFTGFLESGKTTMVKEVLSDPSFNTGEKTLILCCEQGIEEYEPSDLTRMKAELEYIDNLEQGLSLEHLKELNNLHHPDRVMIEYNGTWKVTDYLDSTVPKGWELAQIIATVDASTFQNYVTNMRSLMFEQLRYADLVIFNRVSPDIRKNFLRSNVRTYNRTAQIVYENTKGEIEDMGQDDLPFDLTKDIIDIEPDDYGLWYMDAVDHPTRYEGKTLVFKGIAFPTKQFDKPITAVGRYAMVCCAADKAFMGVGVVDQDGADLQPGTWVEVRGKARVDFDSESDSQYISITDSTITPCVPLENQDVTF